MSDLGMTVRARFERFPATVKGAFVLRGEDRDPHLVSFVEGRVAAVQGRDATPISMDRAVVDVPPHQDVFLPFEFSVTDLEPGWYGLECDLEVDGVSATYPGGRRFAVAWPRGTVRRGSFPLGSGLALDDGTKISLEQLELAGDHASLRFRSEPPRSLSVRVLADGARLAELEREADAETGKGSVMTYPVMRTQSTLRIELKGRGGETSLDLDLDALS